MFNPLRLFRRKDHIDDTAAAYVEGRATERDLEELRARAEKEPKLFEELDSIRNTVTLLRSVETVRAPRSFALAEAPVQVRVKRTRLAMAPAVFAIAAAAAVGLLAVGNLADVVRQSDDSAFSGSDEDPVATSAVSGADSADGQGGAPAGGSSINADSAERQRSDLSAMATATPAAMVPPPRPTTTPLSLDMGGSDSFAGDMPAAAPPVGDGSFAFGETEDSAPAPVVPLADGEPDSGAEGPTDPDTGLQTGEASSPSIDPDEAPAADTESGGPRFDSLGTEDRPSTLPQATVTNLFDDAAPGFIAEQGSPVAESGDEESGVALPLWQLQLAFALLAVVMAGAWFLLQRRLTA